MKAVLAGEVIARADEGDLVRIEGNWYFPPSAVSSDALVESPTPYTCAWKGACQYYTLQAGGERLVDGAWAYTEPMQSAIDRVGSDFSGYIAFGRGVEVVA